MQWWYSIAFQHLAWLLCLVYLQWANPQSYKWNWVPWGSVCVWFFFLMRDAECDENNWLYLQTGEAHSAFVYSPGVSSLQPAWPAGPLLANVPPYVLWMQQWKKLHYMLNLNPQQPEACVGVSGTIKLTSQGRAGPLPRKASITREMEGRMRNKTVLRADCRRQIVR